MNDARAISMVSRGERPDLPLTVSPPICSIINACWAQEPSARPSAEEVMRSLSLTMRNHSFPTQFPRTFGWVPEEHRTFRAVLHRSLDEHTLDNVNALLEHHANASPRLRPPPTTPTPTSIVGMDLEVDSPATPSLPPPLPHIRNMKVGPLKRKRKSSTQSTASASAFLQSESIFMSESTPLAKKRK